MRCENEAVLFRMKVVTKADAARAAAKIGQIYYACGCSWSLACEMATHELAHAQADTSKGLGNPGYFEIEKHFGLIFTFYNPSTHDPKRMMEIVSAPSRLGMSKIPMSDIDISLFQSYKEKLNYQNRSDLEV